MDSKIFNLTIKNALGDQGTFVGMASVYGNVDLDGDVVMPGAFTKSLAERGDVVPLLWQHDQKSPIGMGRLVDTPTGLQLTGQLVLDDAVPDAKRAWALMKAGVLSKMSIGYHTKRAQVVKGVRQLHELLLGEVSLVTIPANPLASISAMKNGSSESALGDLMREMTDGFSELQLRMTMQRLRLFAQNARPR